MKTKRRMELVFERERTIVHSSRYRKEVSWCAVCEAMVEMITVFDAAKLAGISSFTIHDQVQTGQIHGCTTPDGILLVCLNSLSI